MGDAPEVYNLVAQAVTVCLAVIAVLFDSVPRKFVRMARWRLRRALYGQPDSWVNGWWCLTFVMAALAITAPGNWCLLALVGMWGCMLAPALDER